MKKTVLLVDDDESVRGSIEKVLREEDYDVLVAAGGQEAVERFDPARVDVLLLDINMPGCNGWDLFERMTTRNPFLPTIIITGVANQYPVGVAAGVSAVVEKPLDAPALLQVLRAVLEEPPKSRLRRLVGRGEAPRHIDTRDTRPTCISGPRENARSLRGPA